MTEFYLELARYGFLRHLNHFAPHPQVTLIDYYHSVVLRYQLKVRLGIVVPYNQQSATLAGFCVVLLKTAVALSLVGMNPHKRQHRHIHCLDKLGAAVAAVGCSLLVLKVVDQLIAMPGNCCCAATFFSSRAFRLVFLRCGLLYLLPLAANRIKHNQNQKPGKCNRDFNRGFF